MIIRTLNGCCGRKMQAAIMAEALLRGKKLSLSHPFVEFEVEDWEEFMKMYWHICAEYSRDSRGSLLRERIPITVIMPDGRRFGTVVWYDSEIRGLRYVSVN